MQQEIEFKTTLNRSQYAVHKTKNSHADQYNITIRTGTSSQGAHRYNLSRAEALFALNLLSYEMVFFVNASADILRGLDKVLQRVPTSIVRHAFDIASQDRLINSHELRKLSNAGAKT